MPDFDSMSKKIASNYLELIGDIYPQPPDEGHSAMAETVINKWVTLLNPCDKVLDVGCGYGFCQPYFSELGKDWTGVALGRDVLEAKRMGRVVYDMDYHDIQFPDSSFHLIFSRHSLEHSPMPLLALMEWHRVAKNWLILVLPNPISYGWSGLNHYSVLHPNQAHFLLYRAGWRVVWEDDSEETELRFMCEKMTTRLKDYPR